MAYSEQRENLGQAKCKVIVTAFPLESFTGRGNNVCFPLFASSFTFQFPAYPFPLKCNFVNERPALRAHGNGSWENRKIVPEDKLSSSHLLGYLLTRLACSLLFAP